MQVKIGRFYNMKNGGRVYVHNKVWDDLGFNYLGVIEGSSICWQWNKDRESLCSSSFDLVIMDGE